MIQAQGTHGHDSSIRYGCSLGVGRTQNHINDHARVTWNAKGSNLYMMKIMEVFVGVDRLMGIDTGLKNLKTAAEQ